MDPFNLKYCADLNMKTEFEIAKDYINKYFVPLSSGGHAMLVDNGYRILSSQILKEVYFNKLSKELNTYYFKQNCTIKTITCKLNMPLIFGEYINFCPRMKHEYLEFDSFGTETKDSVQIMMNFIRDIICNENVDSFEFVMKWISNMVKGNKNNSCLYLKCAIQGIGKSTLPEFLCDWVIGDKLCLATGSNPLKSNFNRVLEGKLLVLFEELENFSVSEWTAVSSTLKRHITGSRINIESKGIDSYETENINNYILISNNDAIKDDDGRRFNILDMSVKREQDNDYFGFIRSNCFNDTVGQAFYSYLLEIDTEGFNPQKYPISNSKLDSIAKRLDNVYQFLKDEYVILNKSIKDKVGDLYDHYIQYCGTYSKKKYCKIDFKQRLSDASIMPVKSNGNNIYKVSHDTLLKIAKKRHWIHELDEYEESDTPLKLEDDSDIENLKQQNKELKEELLKEKMKSSFKW